MMICPKSVDANRNSIATHLNEFCNGSQEVSVDGLSGCGHVNVVKQAVNDGLKKITTVKQVLQIGTFKH